MREHERALAGLVPAPDPNDFVCVRRLRLLGVYPGPGLLWDRALRIYRTAPQGRGDVSPGGQMGLQCPARWEIKGSQCNRMYSLLLLLRGTTAHRELFAITWLGSRAEGDEQQA